MILSIFLFISIQLFLNRDYKQELVNLFKENDIIIKEININKVDSFLIDDVKFLTIILRSIPSQPIISAEEGEYLISEHNHKLFLLGKVTKPILIFRSDTSKYIGGWSLNDRGKGKFLIFRISKNAIEQIFKSEENLFDKTLNCECFCGDGYLSLSLIDINNDSVNDLVFSGSKCFFCDGLERGFNWQNREPRKKIPVNIKYQSFLIKSGMIWKKVE